MIVEINKVVTYRSNFIVEPSLDEIGFVIGIQNESGTKSLYVTREALSKCNEILGVKNVE